jgi:hypothetical protein
MKTSSRLERAAAVAELETRLAAAGQTQRQAAAALGVARSTLQGWRDAAAPAHTKNPATSPTTNTNRSNNLSPPASRTVTSNRYKSQASSSRYT